MKKETKMFSMKGFLYLMLNPFIGDEKERNQLLEEAIDILNYLFSTRKNQIVKEEDYFFSRAIGMTLFLRLHTFDLDNRDRYKERNFKFPYTNLQLIIEHGRPVKKSSDGIEVFVGCGSYDTSVEYFTSKYGDTIELEKIWFLKQKNPFWEALRLSQKKKELHLFLEASSLAKCNEMTLSMIRSCRIAEQYYSVPVAIFTDDFLGPRIIVKKDTDPALIKRDRARAVGKPLQKSELSLLASSVGPYPLKVLSKEQKEKDLQLARKKLAPLREVWNKRDAQKRIEDQKILDKIQKQLLDSPAMARDEEKWENLLKGTSVGRNLESLEYAEKVARLTQYHMKGDRRRFNKAFTIAFYDAEKLMPLGITGSMHGLTYHALSKYWDLGEMFDRVLAKKMAA